MYQALSIRLEWVITVDFFERFPKVKRVEAVSHEITTNIRYLPVVAKMILVTYQTFFQTEGVVHFYGSPQELLQVNIAQELYSKKFSRKGCGSYVV